jgi:hypothetical protein
MPNADLLQRFLEAFPPFVHPQHAPRAFDADACVAAWQAAASKRGFTCPPELLALSRVPNFVYVGPWELCPPSDDEDPIITMLARDPCLVPLKRMLTVFGADDERLMLSSDGAIRRCSGPGAESYDHGIVTPSFAALLEAFIAREKLPGLWETYAHAGATWRWVWVDGIEYSYLVSHHEEARGGHGENMCCVTSVSIDLAPHYFRYPDGPNRPPLNGHVSRACNPCYVEFVNDPMFIPRRQPLGILDLGERQIDLAVEAERLIRGALERGWTGRDTHKLRFDGWALFGLERPTQIVTL